MREALRRIAFHPLAAPALVALLILDLRSEVPPRGYAGGSTVRAMYWGTGESGTPPGICTRQAVRYESHDWTLVDLSRDPRTRPTNGWVDYDKPTIYDRASVAPTVTFQPDDTASGFWAITRLRRERRVGVDGSLTAEEQAAVRTLFVRSVVADVCPMTPREEARLEREDLTETCVVWSGYVHDGAAGVMVVWLPFACFGAWRFAREFGPERRRRRGLCAGCGYSRGGLAREAVCPECGKSAAVGVAP